MISTQAVPPNERGTLGRREGHWPSGQGLNCLTNEGEGPVTPGSQCSAPVLRSCLGSARLAACVLGVYVLTLQVQQGCLSLGLKALTKKGWLRSESLQGESWSCLCVAVTSSGAAVFNV